MPSSPLLSPQRPSECAGCARRFSRPRFIWRRPGPARRRGEPAAQHGRAGRGSRRSEIGRCKETGSLSFIPASDAPSVISDPFWTDRRTAPQTESLRRALLGDDAVCGRSGPLTPQQQGSPRDGAGRSGQLWPPSDEHHPPPVPPPPTRGLRRCSLHPAFGVGASAGLGGSP